jgi:hypothetical protein
MGGGGMGGGGPAFVGNEWLGVLVRAMAGAAAGAAAAAAADPVPATVRKAIDQAWKDSFLKDDKVTEQGASIIKTKDGKIEIRKAKPGNSGSLPQANFPKPGKGETLVGTFHTHPYSKAEGGHKGVSFSAADITNFLDGSQGTVKYVGAGTHIFILTLDDAAKAKKAKPADVKKAWDDAFKNAKGTFQQKVEAAVQAAIKDTGISYKKVEIK